MFAWLFTLFTLVGCLHNKPEPAVAAPAAPSVEDFLAARCEKIVKYAQDFGSAEDRIVKEAMLVAEVDRTVDQLSPFAAKTLLVRNQAVYTAKNDPNLIEAWGEYTNKLYLLNKEEEAQIAALDEAVRKLLYWRTLNALRPFLAEGITRVESHLKEAGAGDRFTPFDPDHPEPCSTTY